MKENFVKTFYSLHKLKLIIFSAAPAFPLFKHLLKKDGMLSTIIIIFQEKLYHKIIVDDGKKCILT